MDSEETSAADPLLGQTLLGRYTVIHVLGEGGMGKVYLAQQRMGQATRDVAIKTLHPELIRDPQLVARFHRECSTVIGLSHPNTVQFFDFGELEDQTLFIVMEYIQGESLARALERGAMSPERVDKLLIQICGSLHEAHQRGIVHRDLKPENVLLTERGGATDFVKVLDFGIAKRSEAEDDESAKLTKQGMVLGTPPYMSPEQFSGQTLDARSDIYSLGVMTYEMLIGKLPFDGRTPWEWATKHLTEQPAPLEAFPTGSMIAPTKRMAVMRALEKDRGQRQGDVVTYLREFTGYDDPAAAWTMATSVGGFQSGNALSSSQGATPRVPVGTPGPMPQTGGHPTPSSGGWTSTGSNPSSQSQGWATGATTAPGAGSQVGRWLAAGAIAFMLFIGGGAALAVWAFGGGGGDASAGTDPQTPVLPGSGDAPRNDADGPETTAANGDGDQGQALPSGVVPPPPEGGSDGSETADNDAETGADTPPSTPDPPSGQSETASRDARGRAAARRGTAALASNDVDEAARQLASAQRLGGRRAAYVRTLRNELGRKASRRVGILMQQGKCGDAQRLYRALARVGAGGPSQVHFSDWCPRP